MSQTQNATCVLGDSLATIIVVTTPRNEPLCDTPLPHSRLHGKRKYTRTHIAVSVGGTLRKQCAACLGIWEGSVGVT